MKRVKLLDKYYKDIFNGSIIAIVIGILMLAAGIIFFADDGDVRILTGIILIFGIGDIIGGLLRLRFLNKYIEKFKDVI